MKFSGLHKQRLSVEKGGMRQNARRLAADEEKCEREDITLEKREGFFERFFGISQSGSNMRTEVLAGITTFITVAYILILNPQILADPFVIGGDMDMALKSPTAYLLEPASALLLVRFCVRYMQGAFSSGSRYGAECIFCLYGCAGNGVYLSSDIDNCIYFRRTVYRNHGSGLRQAIIRPYRSRLKWRSRRESACLSPLWD